MRILYIGGFEMPDRNAAAQRVLAIAKSIGQDNEIFFVGKTHGTNFSGNVNGFEYRNLPYPKTLKDWVKHLAGIDELNYIKNLSPSLVICYNFPAWGLSRVIRYCKRIGIKTIGDITEWYQPHNFIKRIDTEWRMKILNKKMNGLIVISHYLKDYYAGQSLFLMPPTVDSSEEKWNRTKAGVQTKNNISLLYAGSPGRGDKDRIDNLIKCLLNYSNLSLDVVGISKEDFLKQYPKISIPENVHFFGRQPHEKTIAFLCNSDFSIFFRLPTRVNNAGFPTKFAEAQTAGVPIISSHFSDLDEYVEEGKNGFLAKSISESDIDVVLRKVASLTREEIESMHKYTSGLKKFDIKRYEDSLRNYIENVSSYEE